MSNVKADFYDEKSVVEDKVNGVCLSNGRYAFTNSDSIYKEVCGATLETLGVVTNGMAEMDNVLETYSEASKRSEIFTKNGYVYFLLYKENGEYSDFLDSFVPNFQFRVFSIDSLNTIFNALDKSQYTELTSNHINQPSIYASTKVHFEGTVLEVRDIQNTDAYLIGKVATIQAGDVVCEIWYDYAYYPYTFTVGNSVEVYGTVDSFGDIFNISVKTIS